METVKATIEARHQEYGDYSTQSRIAQQIKCIIFHNTELCRKMSPCQRESLEMIATKISRIVAGNPHNPDSWHDIAGYAQLIADFLTKPSQKA